MGKLEEIYKLRSKSGCTSTMLHIFKEYASKCDHITEFGFGSGHGASGFLMGKPKKYITYDLHLQDVWKEYKEMLEADTDFIAIQADTGNMPMIEATDLLWIDTLHTYTHLKKELTLHGNQARKWIIMHDTKLYGERGPEGTRPGLRQALEEFVEENPHWKIKEIITTGPGLTILERIDA